MRCNTNVALVSLGLLLGTAGCDTFLTGDKLSNNPNLPTAASIQQLFVGVQAGQFAFQEGTVAMMLRLLKRLPGPGDRSGWPVTDRAGMWRGPTTKHYCGRPTSSASTSR